jgi:hypothetical protein
MAKEYNHVDAIGRPLKIGDPIAIPIRKTELLIGRITSMGEKKIRVAEYKQPAKVENWKGKMIPNGSLRYPSESVLLDGPDILIYLMKLNLDVN